MGTIYNYLKIAWKQKNNALDNNKLSIFFPALVLITILLDFKYNSIALSLYVLFCIFNYKKSAPLSFKNFILPVVFFILMAISLLWSVNLKASANALVKELPLLLIPLAFCIGPPITKYPAGRIVNLFSKAVVVYGIWYMIRACYKYSPSHDANVFFYHQFSGDNAIYTSAVFAIALFYYISKPNKAIRHYGALFFIMFCLILLSSKTIIITSLSIIAAYYIGVTTVPLRTKAAIIILFAGILVGVGYYGKVKDRIMSEYTSNTSNTRGYIDTGKTEGFVYDVNVRDAWTKEKFNLNNRFTGTSFRVYQARIFKEMLEDDAILFTGYGINASQEKIMQKGTEHHVFMGNEENIGYQTMNFHNQYIQCFAELGIFGLLIMLAMLALNLKNALKNKDFIHIAFAILMISLFLTESFLWRQRGVVLFTMLYCVFNTIAIGERKKI